MADHLPNYLKSHRRRSGLSQDEVAFLVGGSDGSKLSRYENQVIVPPLEIALALEAIFGTPVAGLFAGVHDSVGKQVGTRIAELIKDLEQRNTPTRYRSIAQQKLGWLEEHPVLAARREDAIPCK